MNPARLGILGSSGGATLLNPGSGSHQKKPLMIFSACFTRYSLAPSSSMVVRAGMAASAAGPIFPKDLRTSSRTLWYNLGFMRPFAAALAWLAVAAWLAACAAPLPASETEARDQVVYVVSNGWHTAIVVPGPALRARQRLPEAGDFPEAAYLEFGWGDRIYYRAKDPGPAIALARRAAAGLTSKRMFFLSR